MKIDLTCPVELWQYAMPGEDSAECTFVMNNLSDKVVTSVQVTLSCFGADDELLFKQTERMQGLKAGVGERFSVVLLPSEWNGVAGVDLVIEKVWFDDSTIWRRGGASLTYYTPNALAPGRALDDLRFVAGKDAAGYPERQDYVWMCVCGRANALDSDRCCRCERRRDAVFASFSQENVRHIIAAHEQKLADAARKARQDNNILQENREKQLSAKRRRQKLLVRWTATLALVTAAALTMWFWGVPLIQYNTAVDLRSNGRYDQAREAFLQMGDYRDAVNQVLETDYQQAESLREAGDLAGLESAEALYASLEGYQDSADKLNQTRYALGDLYLEAKSYELAVEKFQQLGSYQDSADKVQLIIYRQAVQLMDGGSYEAARVLFTTLSGYEDAQQLADECALRMAELSMTDSDYPAALAVLESLPGNERAQGLIDQCHYAMAEAALESGEYEQAGQLFLLAGDLSDAQERANECLYTLAKEQRAAGEYEKAMALFLQIPGYLDSEEQAKACVYEQAKGLMAAGDPANAAALLETIPGYEDAQAQLNECRLLLAEQALDAGDAAQAERLLQSVEGVKDADRQLEKVRYQLAESAMDSGDYASALERYEALGSYKDSKTKVKQARYGLANAHREAGKYEEAIDLYTQLGSYKESKTHLKACRYALAAEALKLGEYAQAIALFEDLGSYEDSREQLAGAKYQQAMAAKEAGDTAGAIALLSAQTANGEAMQALAALRMQEAARLEEAGDDEAAAQLYEAVGTEEAAGRAQACRYRLAEKLYQSGDLPAAAAAFHQLGTYKDAAARSEACYAEYYGQVAQNARDLYAAGDDEGVISALRGFEMNVLSETYDDLPDIFAAACVEIGDGLYADGKPYEAMPYYQHANAQDKLDRRAYLILGEWESATGKTAAFRTDGTCDLMGETLYFRVSNFSLYTGQTPDSMTITHKISSLDEQGLSLREMRGDTLYKFTRTGDFALPLLPLPEESHAE